MCGALLAGVWWIFPLLGFALCLGFMFLAFRSGCAGRGCMCMGNHRGITDDQGAQAGHGVSAKASR